MTISDCNDEVDDNQNIFDDDHNQDKFYSCSPNFPYHLFLELRVHLALLRNQPRYGNA